jgi:glycosyltransferase involved in cell wall biosynthesis
MAKSNIEFLGWKIDDELSHLYRGCKALIFPGEEDFGIVPLEAMATGKPVVAFGKGGALETVVEGTTGTFFYAQTVESLSESLMKIRTIKFDPAIIRNHALRFTRSIYKQKMHDYIDAKVRQHLLR